MRLPYEDEVYEYTCSDLIYCSDSLICGYISIGNYEGEFVYHNVKGYYKYVIGGEDVLIHSESGTFNENDYLIYNLEGCYKDTDDDSEEFIEYELTDEDYLNGGIV